MGKKSGRKRDSFVCDAELGERLRQLRLKARLTQKELAEAMGRKPASAHPVISKLEKGRIPSPGIGLIADFLRACRAKFADIADILDKYTARPAVPDKQVWNGLKRNLQGLPPDIQTKVHKYDVKTKAARKYGPHPHKPGRKPEPVPPRKRIERGQKLAAAWMQRRKLDAWLMDACNELKTGWNTAPANALKDHARKVWGILKRTRTMPGDVAKKTLNERVRGDRLAEAMAKTIARHDATHDAVLFVHEHVIELFKLMESNGELDYMPLPGEIARDRRFRKRQARKRKAVKLAFAGLDPVDRLKVGTFSSVQHDVISALLAEGMDKQQALRYGQWIKRLYKPVLDNLHDPAGMKQVLDTEIAGASNPAEARKVAARFLRRLHPRLPRLREAIPAPGAGTPSTA